MCREKGDTEHSCMHSSLFRLARKEGHSLVGNMVSTNKRENCPEWDTITVLDTLSETPVKSETGTHFV